MNVMWGSESHVKAMVRECQTRLCDPLGLALLLNGAGDAAQPSSDWRRAAKQLRIGEFYARRIAQLWREDQVAAIRVSLMVGLFQEPRFLESPPPASLAAAVCGAGADMLEGMDVLVDQFSEGTGRVGSFPSMKNLAARRVAKRQSPERRIVSTWESSGFNCTIFPSGPTRTR